MGTFGLIASLGDPFRDSVKNNRVSVINDSALVGSALLGSAPLRSAQPILLLFCHIGVSTESSPGDSRWRRHACRRRHVTPWTRSSFIFIDNGQVSFCIHPVWWGMNFSLFPSPPLPSGIVLYSLEFVDHGVVETFVYIAALLHIYIYIYICRLTGCSTRGHRSTTRSFLPKCVILGVDGCAASLSRRSAY